MPGRYDPASRFKGVDPSKFAPRQMTSAEKKKDEQADWMRFLGDVAPAAGGVLGGIGGGLAGTFLAPGIGTAAGAGLGASIGGGLGSMAGTALNAGADHATSGYEDEEANKRAQRDAMLATLMGLRR